MEGELREIEYDRELDVEVYRLSGVVQKFPNHFHECYVIGYLERGRRHLRCGGAEYDLDAGDLVLFNPRESHFCAPVDGEPLDYRAVNLSPERMARAAEELTGRPGLPRFVRPVARDSEAAPALETLYRAVRERAPLLEREEALFFLLDQVLREHASLEDPAPRPDDRVRDLCAYLEAHVSENVGLDQLCRRAAVSKSQLLRSFTRQMGVSPYRYLQTLRLNRARTLLEEGTAPAEAAARTGFADQSHFTRFFKECIGLTPGQYQRVFTQEKKERTNGLTAGKMCDGDP